jgi:hypothetical protein
VDTEPSVVGRTGTLLVAARGPDHPGEVLVKIRGGSETFFAVSDEPLPVGAAVLIIESFGTRTVHVVEWIDPNKQE